MKIDTKSDDSFKKDKLPMMLRHLTNFDLSLNYISDEDFFESSIFSQDKKINIHSSGSPLYCAVFKSPPTSVTTPAKIVPAGWTSGGKYKAQHYTPAKTDKRAGQ
jgi:hypothetical protein